MRRRGTIILVIVLALAALGYLELPGTDHSRQDEGPPTAATPGATVVAEVLRIVDGDTAVVAIDGRQERLRYIGIDTPESVQSGKPVECFGREASRRNAELVSGRMVRLEIGLEPRDRYGRLLAYVWIGDRLVNEEMLRDGYATSLTIPPNDRYAARFNRLQAQAERARKGLWRYCR